MTSGEATINPRTAVGTVRLRVADLEGARGFYERVIGLEPVDSSAFEIRLGAAGVPLVELFSAPDAPARPRRTTGLFHLAILVPDRARLGAALRRIEDAGWGLTGASDHLVSEALYTADPEGNGIEIYRDRPRPDWPRFEGSLQMDTLPLDLASVLADAGEGASGGMASGAVIGHVHLNVAGIAEAEAFYSGVLGFEVTVNNYPGALFVAAGGYHHHIGLNVWAGEGAPQPPAGSRGLDYFEIVVPDGADVAAAAARLEGAGVPVEGREDGALRFNDPSGNGILLRSAPSDD